MIQKDSLYIFQPTDSVKQSINTDSLSRFFSEGGSTQITENKPLKIISTPTWMHLSLVFWIVVVLFAKQAYSIRLRQIIVAAFKPKQVKLLHRDGNILKQGVSILLFLLYAFTVSLFAFILINKYIPGSFYFSMGTGFILLMGSIISYHIIKFLLIWVLGFLFETQDRSLRYLLDQYIFNITEGIVLFPLLILSIYSEIQLLLYIAVVVLIGFWIYRFSRAIFIGLASRNFSLSYIFLYLCTLEVLPILLIYKLSIQFV